MSLKKSGADPDRRGTDDRAVLLPMIAGEILADRLLPLTDMTAAPTAPRLLDPVEKSRRQ